jgi:glycosyltransferase involved in cell wall biosynthesis
MMKSHSEVVYNGIYSLRNLPPNDDVELPLLSDHIKFVFIGLLHPGKNVEEAFEILYLAMKAGLNVSLDICGEGQPQYKDRLKEIIEKKRIAELVKFQGYLDDITPVLNSSHFLIMPSKNEAMGRVTLEALFHGVPVIGRDSGGTSELFTDGIHGLLYNNPDEISSRLKNLTQKEYATMSKNALILARSKYTIEEYGDKMLEIINRVSYK